MSPSRAQWVFLSLLPLLVGWVVWQRVMPDVGTPGVLRVQHPALPQRYAVMENPYAHLPEEEREVHEREGLVLYQKNCRPCHGTTATGTVTRGKPCSFSAPGRT